MAQRAGASPLPREKIVQLIVGMLNKQGEKMAAELERRIDAGLGLEVRGIKVDVSMLTEALDHYFEEHPDEQAGGSSKSAGPVSARWLPAAPSASLLTAQALQECERAEAFHRKVRVVAGAGKVPVLSRPERSAGSRGEALAEGAVVDVIARFACQQDGRVYLRLKAKTGWISTRSIDDLTKVVLEPIAGDSALEPARFAQPRDASATSMAMRLLPLLDPETESVISVPAETAVASSAVAGVIDATMVEGGDEAHEDALGGDEGGEEEVDDDALDPEEDCDDVEEEGDHDGQATSGTAASSGALVTGHAVKRFKVVLSRVPVLSAPGAEHLDKSNHVRWLQLKEEFVADGVAFFKAEGRAYLRLRNGRGWICENSRSELWRAAVVPVTKRKQQLSKKMVKAVAFRGGDTDGLTRLTKEDLVKNRSGKIVSKKASEAAKKRYADSGASKWVEAVKRAKTEMGLAGFVAAKKGTPLYEKAQVYYKELTAGEPAAKNTKVGA